MSEPDYVANPIGSDFDADERALNKAKKDGTEGLSESEIRDLKRMPDIGVRHELPEVYY